MAARPGTAQRGMGPPTAARGPVAGAPIAGVAPKGFAPSSGFAAPPGMRPPSNAGNRPGSSAGVPMGMRPPTASAGGPALAGPGAAGVPLHTDVQVAVRPVTGMASGLRGMPTAKLGPDRVIADKTYYLTELTRKLHDIDRELGAMEDENGRIASGNQLYAQLERRYDAQMKDVRQLEGQLADFNLAFDKLRTNTNVAEIHEAYAQLKQRNEHEKRAVDDVFIKVSQQEKQTQEIEERIANLHAAAADRIAALGEEKQQEYLDLQDELASLNERVGEREAQLHQLEREIGGYEQTMKSDAYQLYQQGSSLNKEIHALQRQKQELEDELHSALSPAEMRERLTQRIKDATVECTELESKIGAAESSLEKLGEQLRSKENELADAKKHSSKARKYEAIYERDARMHEFVEGFPRARQLEQESKRKLQQVIVDLLRHISKGLGSAQNLAAGAADAGKMAELRSELTFKEEKMADSAKTLALLRTELASSKEKLAQVEQLDSKIGGEIAQLRAEVSRMHAEMREYKTDDELKAAAVRAKKELLVQNSRARKAREAIKAQVAQLSAECDRRSRELQASETWKKIEAWETKLKNHAGAVFTLQEFIDHKKRDSDYEPLMQECADISRQINERLIAGK